MDVEIIVIIMNITDTFEFSLKLSIYDVQFIAGSFGQLILWFVFYLSSFSVVFIRQFVIIPVNFFENRLILRSLSIQ